MKIITVLNKMYYVPPTYYWIDKNIYDNVKVELLKRLEINKKIYYDNLKTTNKNNLIEKGPEYIEYKSNLIKTILLEYAHNNPNRRGKDLLDSIFDKWNQNKMIKEKTRIIVYERTINNITKYEKVINNIEEIMMLISLNILENY
jgi:hypothetical protein